jgi:hypothetical protein
MQDALAIAQLIQSYNTASRGKTGLLSQLTQQYEQRRKLPTALLTGKANILGRIETLSGGVGMWTKDTFFRSVKTFGVLEREFLVGASLQVD